MSPRQPRGGFGGGHAPRAPGSLPPARKSLGQHFLTDKSILTRIADALHLTGKETVIEIGPGRGALTDLLVERAGRLIAVEVDRALIPILRERYAKRGHVIVLEADVLTLTLGEIAQGPFRLVGNVPYYITTPILFHALEPPRADVSVFLVQKEVAERVVAAPGSKVYGALSVNVQALAVPQLLFKVPASAFRPAPKVESAVLRVTPRAEPLVSADRETRFKQFVVACFGLRRKQLVRVVRTVRSLDAERAAAVVSAAGLDAEARPETLSPAEFVRLLECCESEGQ